MSKTEVRILHEKIPFILNNIYQVNDLIPYLISQHVLTHVTEMFIREPRNKEERLLRLINVLTTKHYGIKALCNALTHTNQEFIADEISREYILTHDKVGKRRSAFTTSVILRSKLVPRSN